MSHKVPGEEEPHALPTWPPIQPGPWPHCTEIQLHSQVDMHLLATTALGSNGPHLDSGTHYLGGLSCRHRCLLLHLGLRLWLLHHHRRTDLKEEGRMQFGATESRVPTISGGALNLEAFREKEDGIIMTLLGMSPYWPFFMP